MTSLRGTVVGLCVAMCGIISVNWARSDKEIAVKEAQAASLRQMLENTRDSLQNDIAQRWRGRQRSVEQREADKEELSRLKDLQERSYNELERAKEECLSKEKAIEDANTALAVKQDEWRIVAAALDEVLAKEAEAIVGAFPLDLEQRQNDLENLRRRYQKKQDAAATLDGFVAYMEKYIEIGNSLFIVRQKVLLENEKPVMLSVARFGNVFGYGMSENGTFYFIRQTGRMGAERYRIDKIDAAPLQTSLLRIFPSWIAAGKPSGPVPTDVMQNEQTKMLVAGKKITEYQKFYASIKAGGAVMVPLLFLPLWSMALIALKLFQFGTRRGRFAKQFKTTIAYLENNDSGKALSYVRSCKGVVARIFEVCLSRTNAQRSAVEKSVRELLIEEIPLLNRHLNTLAVIAGAAPLLGLLGTISGMINLFGAVTHYGTGDPKFLAGGISEALITAKTGLAIAIPVLFIHDYLRNKKDRLQADIEKYALRIVNKLWPEG